MARKPDGKRLHINDPSSDAAITVSGVSKSFRLPHNRQNSVKGVLVNLVSGGDRTFETQQVLKDISFEIKKGEFFGIVGRNGSGKSTLLKMLAGIYKPTHGQITVNGSLTPFIELGVGFNPELTGRENVFLNGALLGFNEAEVAAMYNDIVAFAELERFMDQKLKNYSSGMQVRLAFSIAIRAKSDILVLDEVLAVGDEAFQRKCFRYFENLKRQGKTVVLVTHDMNAVEQFCSRALLIDDGIIVEVGSPYKVSALYSRKNELTIDSIGNAKLDKETINVSKIKTTLLSADGHKTNTFAMGDVLKIELAWPYAEAKYVGVSLIRLDGTYVYGTNTLREGLGPVGKKTATYTLNLNVATGSYFLKVAVFGETEKDVIDFDEEGPVLEVTSGGVRQRWGGITKLEHEWRLH